MPLDKLKVRLVLQGQHMQQVVDCEHSYSPVPYASRFRTRLALATTEDMLIDHVDISQAFLQGDLLEEEGFEGDVFISPLPMVRMQNISVASAHCYMVPAPAVGHGTKPCQLLCKASRQSGDKIIVGSQIVDFCICGTNCACLDKFRFTLLDPAKDRFEGTYEGPLHHYTGCAIAGDLDVSTTSLSQAHYIESVCQTYGQWNVTLPKTPMMPDTRLTVDDCPEGYVDPHFHAQYQGIVASQGL